MVDVFVYPYETLEERRKITYENNGRFSDLGNCLMFITYHSKKPTVVKLVNKYEK